ncbi:MAG: SusC/RagA family TonB-linked outer membrane protein [Ferruginibacter sp.]
MRKIVLTLLVGLSFVLNAMAQERTVSGKVVDPDGKPVSNASVIVVGSNKGTSTSGDGNFSISVPTTATALNISAVGFETQRVSIRNISSVSISLVAKKNDLDEVVITGYGAARKKQEVTGSVATVSAERIANKPNANVFDALQGNVPGLQVFSNGGEPTMPLSLRINGTGSLGASSTPLYIMDGVPIDPGTVLSLNPNDFESVTVLRDASATSIYGSRAANGVVIFTSKKGKANQFKINLTSQYGVSNLLESSEDIYNSFMNTQQFTDFLVSSGQQTQAQVDATLANYHADTKWYKTYFKENAPLYQADLSISGGSGKTTYFMSGSYLNQEGLAYRSGYKRYSLRTNLNTTLTDWFQMGMNLFGSYDEREQNQYFENQSTGQAGNSLNGGLSLLNQPYFSPNDSTGKAYYGLIPGLNRYHPKYLADKFPSVGNNTQLNPTVYVQISPVKNLAFVSRAGLEFYDYRSSAKRLPSYLGNLGNGQVVESFSRGATGTFTNTLEYKFKVGDRNNFTALAGQEFIQSRTTGYSASSTGQSDDRLMLLSNGTTNITASSSRSEYAYSSLFGKLSYNHDSKYFIDLSVRNDQSSRFGRDLKGATFYAVGAMWHATKEKFLDNVSWLTDLMVKGSIGTSGNSAIGNYDALGKVASSVSAAYNTGNGYTITDPGNPQLSWEKQRQVNFGFSAVLFKNISVEAEYFNRLTTSMLVDVPYPYTSGFSSITTNVGSLVNRGINAKISYDIIRKRNSFLTVYGNLGYVQNEVKELFQGKDYWYIPNTGILWAVGKPITYMQAIYSHVDPATGKPLWFVPGSDITKTNKDYQNVTSTFIEEDLLQNSGINLYAPLNGGFGFSGGIHGFSISAHFSYSSGKYLINNDRYFYENPGQFAGYNQSVSVLDYWKQPGDVTRFPKMGEQFTQFDTRLIENASFLRMKDLTFGYDVSKELLQRKNKVVSGLSFYVTLRNMLTFTKYQGPDPEVDTNVTLGANPNTRQTVAGIKIQFN